MYRLQLFLLFTMAISLGSSVPSMNKEERSVGEDIKESLDKFVNGKLDIGMSCSEDSNCAYNPIVECYKENRNYAGQDRMIKGECKVTSWLIIVVAIVCVALVILCCCCLAKICCCL